MAKKATENGEVKAKRVKRGFKKIIIDKVMAHVKGASTPEIKAAIAKIDAALTELETVIVDSKKASKKEKARIAKLQKYSKAELQEALNAMK